MQTDNPGFETLSRAFFDADYARELLEALRWPDGPVCPHCGVEGEAYKLTPKAGSDKPVRPGVYKCGTCRKQFTVTVGTIFEGSKISLNKWVYALHLMTCAKKGISAHQLHRVLGVQYKTAWFMNHRIRKAMEREPVAGLLSGVVEADETYIGGKGTGSSGGPTAGGSKSIAFVLIERDGDARSEVVADVTGDTLKDVIRQETDRKARMMTDTLASYDGLAEEFAGHETVNHSAGEYSRGDAHVNTAESYFSLLKRGIVGTFHHVSHKHLPRYLAEFDFRWCFRKVEDGERLVAAVQATGGKRLYYRTPKGSAA